LEEGKKKEKASGKPTPIVEGGEECKKKKRPPLIFPRAVKEEERS